MFTLFEWLVLSSIIGNICCLVIVIILCNRVTMLENTVIKIS